MCFIIFATGFFGLLSFFSQCKDKYRTKFDYQWLKHRWCAWDSNPGKQDGRRRWIHWAKAAVNDSCLVGVTNKVLQYCHGKSSSSNSAKTLKVDSLIIGLKFSNLKRSKCWNLVEHFNAKKCSSFYDDDGLCGYWEGRKEH